MKKQRKYLILPLIIIGVVFALFIARTVQLYFAFRYPYVAKPRLLLYMSFLCTLPAILSVIYLLLRRWLKKWMRIVATALAIVAIPFSLLNMLLMGFICPFGSQTSNTDDYLITDGGYVQKVGKLIIFPQEIPASAKDAEYFYRYRYDVEADFDVYLKLELSESEFAAEMTRIETQFHDALRIENEEGTIEFRIRYHDGSGYFSYEFVTFSAADLTVTYIEAYTVDDGGGRILPYFKEIGYSNCL